VTLYDHFNHSLCHIERHFACVCELNEKKTSTYHPFSIRKTHTVTLKKDAMRDAKWSIKCDLKSSDVHATGPTHAEATEDGVKLGQKSVLHISIKRIKVNILVEHSSLLRPQFQ